jgi:hypothetical protein
MRAATAILALGPLGLSACGSQPFSSADSSTPSIPTPSIPTTVLPAPPPEAVAPSVTQAESVLVDSGDPVSVTGYRIGDRVDNSRTPDVKQRAWLAVSRDDVVIGYTPSDMRPPPPVSQDTFVRYIYDEQRAIIGHFGDDGLPVLD